MAPRAFACDVFVYKRSCNGKQPCQYCTDQRIICTYNARDTSNSQNAPASCLRCRTRKVKCDKQWPCGACEKAKATCKYDSGGTDWASGGGANVGGANVEGANGEGLTSGGGGAGSGVPSLLQEHWNAVRRNTSQQKSLSRSKLRLQRATAHHIAKQLGMDRVGLSELD